jgi:hypothetical protein
MILVPGVLGPSGLQLTLVGPLSPGPLAVALPPEFPWIFFVLFSLTLPFYAQFWTNLHSLWLSLDIIWLMGIWQGVAMEYWGLLFTHPTMPHGRLTPEAAHRVDVPGSSPIPFGHPMPYAHEFLF